MNTCLLPAYLISICFWMACAVTVRAQTEREILLPLNDGGVLTGEYKMYLHKDQQSYLWTSSTNGIYRYNGFEAKQYVDGASKNIQSGFFEDKHGNLWLTSYDKLHCYLARQDTLQNFFLSNEQGDTLSGLHLFYLQNDSVLWLKSDTLIFRCSIGEFDDCQALPYLTEGYQFTIDTNDFGEVNTIFASPWLGGSGFEKWTKTPAGSWDKTIVSEIDGKQLTISQILINNDSSLWLLSLEGIWLCNTNNNYHLTEISIAGMSSLHWVRGQLQNDASLLVATHLHGLIRVKKIIGSQGLENYQISRTSLSTDSRSYGLWANGDELPIISDKNNEVYVLDERYQYLAQRIKNIPIGIVDIILEDSTGKKWIGSSEKGINVFSQDGTMLHEDPYKIKFAPNEKLEKLAADTAGLIWAMTGQGTVYRFSETWEVVLQSDLQLYSMLHLSCGRIMFTTSKGIKELKTINGKNTLTDAVEFTHISEESIFEFFESKKGLTYLAYEDQDIWIYECMDEKLEKRQIINNNTQIYSFSESITGDTIFVGTSSGVISIANNQKMEIHQLNRAEFADRNIYKILQTGADDYWVTTNDGIWHSKDTLLHKFTEHDGFTNEWFGFHGGLKATDGSLWIGNEKGLTIFKPENITPSEELPVVHIERLLVNQAPYQDRRGIYIDKLEKIDLKHFENNLEFKTTPVGYYHPESYQIMWKMDGYNDEWEISPNVNALKLSRVPYGNYTLHLKGLNGNHVEGKVKSLAINIAYPFWLTYWFWTLVALGVGGLAYLISWIIVRQKLKEQEYKLARQKALFEERNRIAADLHDDIGSTLSNINILSTLAKQKLQSTSPALPTLERIEEEASTSAESLDDIIWSINSKNDQLDRVFARMRRFASEIFEAQDIMGKIIFPKNVNHIKLDIKKRREFYLLFKEATNNMAKYAQCTEASISVTLEHNRITLAVTDNGKGFDINDKSNVGNGLRTMRERTRKLDGEIWINSSSGKGTSIKVQFPITEIND